MQINSCNSYNNNFKATLKIYNHLNSQLSDKTAKYIEKEFAILTANDKGNLDLILFNRYNSHIAKPDRILYTEGEYTDYADTYFKHVENKNDIVSKLLKIFYGFKNIKEFKDNVKKLF